MSTGDDTFAPPAPVSPRPEEFEAAFRLLYRHLPPLDQPRRVAAALQMVARGELGAANVAILRRGGEVSGVMVHAIIPGQAGIVWPPQVIDGPDSRRDEGLLIDHARTHLRSGGARFVQCLVPPDETAGVEALARHGFRHFTDLLFLRLVRKPSRSPQPAPPDFRLVPCANCEPGVVERLLEETYLDTLDCPELQGLRTADELLSGYRDEAGADPSLWWVATLGDTPAGIILVSRMQETAGWEVAYVGVVPGRRRRGVARALIVHVLRLAGEREVPEVTVTVDERNRPALELYSTLGFESYDRREVHLLRWDQR